jgi:hypothetical protein
MVAHVYLSASFIPVALSYIGGAQRPTYPLHEVKYLRGSYGGNFWPAYCHIYVTKFCQYEMVPTILVSPVLSGGLTR